MKLSDVVAQLQLVLPQYTDYFSEVIEIESIEAEEDMVTIKTVSDHNMTTNNGVTITDVKFHNSIIAFAKSGYIYSFETEYNHDITYGYPGYETIEFGGFTESDWNDSFNLISASTRKLFSIQSTNDQPVLTGSEYLLEKRIDGVNGRFKVTVVDSKTFTISGEFEPGVYSGGYIKTKVRIAGSISIERTLKQYTENGADKLWAFVSMHDAIASKNRNAYNDGVATFANGEDVRLRLIDGFSVFVIANTSESIAAVDAIDICRHELLSPILKSLYGVKFPTGLYADGDFKSIITGHGKSFYDGSILVYQYNFEFSNDITLSDQVENDNTRAFSKINYIQEMNPDVIIGDHPTSFPLPFPVDFDESAIPNLDFQTELPE